MTCDSVSFIKDIILSIAAIAIASVAIYGLNTWRRQHIG